MSGRIDNKARKPVEMNPITRFIENPTRKGAIHAKCAECMGCSSSLQGKGFKDHLEPGFRALIRDCTSPACPIFQYRPFKDKK